MVQFITILLVGMLFIFPQEGKAQGLPGISINGDEIHFPKYVEPDVIWEKSFHMICPTNTADTLKTLLREYIQKDKIRIKKDGEMRTRIYLEGLNDKDTVDHFITIVNDTCVQVVNVLDMKTPILIVSFLYIKGNAVIIDRTKREGTKEKREKYILDEGSEDFMFYLKDDIKSEKLDYNYQSLTPFKYISLFGKILNNSKK